MLGFWNLLSNLPFVSSLFSFNSSGSIKLSTMKILLLLLHLPTELFTMVKTNFHKLCSRSKSSVFTLCCVYLCASQLSQRVIDSPLASNCPFTFTSDWEIFQELNLFVSPRRQHFYFKPWPSARIIFRHSENRKRKQRELIFSQQRASEISSAVNLSTQRGTKSWLLHSWDCDYD